MHQVIGELIWPSLDAVQSRCHTGPTAAGHASTRGTPADVRRWPCTTPVRGYGTVLHGFRAGTGPAGRHNGPAGSAGGWYMATEQSPTVRRRRLALELRRLREAARLTCEEVAEHLECSASKISRVETGRVSVSPRDVRDMLELYGVTGKERDSLVQLARDSRQKGWWHAYSDPHNPQIGTYVGLESAASEIRVYEVSLIPSLLQTEDYARAIITSGMMNGAGDNTERSVALRMARQPALTRAEPPLLWTVLDEAALRRRVGGAELMRAQLEHVLELA